MNILGIESTAHTLGVGIVTDKGKIFANERDTLKTEGRGFLPREIAEHNFAVAPSILDSALEKSKLSMKDIDLISFSQGPGFGQCLGCGAVFGRSLSLKYGIPLIGINHCVAHIEIGKLVTGLKDPLTIFTSGANTQIIAHKNGRYRVFGETLDMGLGNAIDHLGRYLGYGFPSGQIMDSMYSQGNYIDLPYTVKGMDLAFSGILTAARNKIGKESKEDISHSFLHNVYSMLLEVTERALAYTQKKELLVVGGVAASKPLREMTGIMAKDRGIKVAYPEMQYCGDNGAMIAWQGYLQYVKGKERMKIEDTVVKPYQRLDSVEISYI
ncbi:MAG: KEOPS complex N(6)-L-threonylcarbamoyladenine synthase Kae1 [Candidatus ainarchaeum sp.]|nr:KEOPS complex N(6)-L-threonylcarbamoyladenine synthase Kae1 [Candidatus ainarchaeum sp.]